MESQQSQKDAAFDRRKSDSGTPQAPTPEVRDELPELEVDAAGIPTFVFKDELAERDRPSDAKKTLEVMFLWREAILGAEHFSSPQPVTVGDSAKNTFRFAIPGLKPIQESFAFLDNVGGQFVINWTDSMILEVKNESGEIWDKTVLDERQLARKVTTAGAGAGQGVAHYQYKIGLNDRVAVQIDQVTFVVQYVAPAFVAPVSFFKTIDLLFAKILSLSILGHAFIILSLFLTPRSEGMLPEDLFKNPNRWAKLLLKEQEKPPPKKKFELSGSKGGAKHKDEEGKFGKKDIEKKDALASAAGAPVVDPNKREKDRKIALQSGLLNVLGGAQGAVSNVLGPGGLGTGINNALGGIRGTAMGDAGGAGGLGTRGSGPGGGGNSLGIGGLGSGTGRGTGGLGEVDLGGSGKGNYAVIPGRTITKGCLSREVVARVLNRISSQIKYCYERELTRDPNLSGKIAATFEVGATGAVMTSRISETTMNDQAVEQCILRVIERLRFPPCEGGGVAEINYPWIFKAGGA